MRGGLSPPPTLSKWKGGGASAPLFLRLCTSCYNNRTPCSVNVSNLHLATVRLTVDHLVCIHAATDANALLIAYNNIKHGYSTILHVGFSYSLDFKVFFFF